MPRPLLKRSFHFGALIGFDKGTRSFPNVALRAKIRKSGSEPCCHTKSRRKVIDALSKRQTDGRGSIPDQFPGLAVAGFRKWQRAKVRNSIWQKRYLEALVQEYDTETVNNPYVSKDIELGDYGDRKKTGSRDEAWTHLSNVLSRGADEEKRVIPCPNSHAAASNKPMDNITEGNETGTKQGGILRRFWRGGYPDYLQGNVRKAQLD